jgi:hypothetical protein
MEFIDEHFKELLKQLESVNNPGIDIESIKNALMAIIH